MRIKPAIGSVVAPTDAHHWGQVLILPAAYGVVEIFDAEGTARDIGLRLLSDLSDGLSEPIVSLSGIEAVAAAVAHQKLVSLILLVPVGKVVYLVLVGEGAVYLKRGDRVAKLLDAAGSLSGELVPGDTLLIVTKRLADAVGDAELASIFDHLDAGTIAEALTLRLSEEDGAVGGAGLVFGVGELIPIEAEGKPETAIAEEEAPVGPPLRFRERISLHYVKRTLHQRLPQVTHLWHRSRERFSGRNGVLLAVAALSLLLFVGSVILGIRKQLGRRVDTQVAVSLLAAQHAYEEGVALLDLNPVKGRSRLTEAKLIIDSLAATVSAKTKTGRQIATLSQAVNQQLSLSLQVVRGEPQLFYDASLLKKGAITSSVALKDDQLGLLDGVGKTVFLLNAASKNGQIIAGGEQFTGAQLVAMHGDKVYVLVPEGIHMIRLEDKKTEPLIIKKSSEWGTIASIFAFGGNLYLLDTAKSRIWKYVATEKATPAGGQGFSELREYLNPDTLPDFSRATNMAIDGSVWVGKREGQVVRFTQGKENTFVPQGVTPGLGQDLIIYTSDAVKNVYVLDRDSKRVVMLTKDGEYLSQYVWESALAPAQLVVSERLKKIFILADGKIYALDLK